MIAAVSGIPGAHYMIALKSKIRIFRGPASETEITKPKRPVILVHGFKDTARKMQWMASILRGQGWTVHTPTLSPSCGQVGLDQLAHQLAAFINDSYGSTGKFDLVGFSMGGLICRYFIQRIDSFNRVERLVTLGSPHNGSLWAYLVQNPGCRQMRPRSDFLNDLNSDITSLTKVDFTSIWTPLDLMIMPSVSSKTGVGREIALWLPFHPHLVWSRPCIEKIAGVLKA